MQGMGVSVLMISFIELTTDVKPLLILPALSTFVREMLLPFY